MKIKHSQILKRAWQILWQYRALWVFGIILALTTVSTTGQTGYRFGGNDKTSPSTQEFDINPDESLWPQVFDQMNEGMDEALQEFSRLMSEKNEDELERTFVRAAVIISVVMVVLYLVGQIFRYISETSLVKMVDDYEETGEKLTAKEGWRLGWSREAWRLFLIDLVIELPLAIIFILLFAIAISPLLLWTTGSPMSGMLGVVASIGLMLLLFLVWLAMRAFLSLAKPMFRREVILEGRNVREALRAGTALVRKYWRDTGVLWLIVKGIDLVWPLVMLPFAMLAGGIGLLFGGGVTLLFGGRAIENGDPSMVWPIVAGVFLLIVIIAIPLAFLNGLRKTFQSSSWTLTYRELKLVSTLKNGSDLPELDLPAEPQEA